MYQTHAPPSHIEPGSVETTTGTRAERARPHRNGRVWVLNTREKTQKRKGLRNESSLSHHSLSFPKLNRLPASPFTQKKTNQVLKAIHTAEMHRLHGGRNILKLLSVNTRRTKVVAMSTGTHRVPDELRRHQVRVAFPKSGGTLFAHTRLTLSFYLNSSRMTTGTSTARTLTGTVTARMTSTCSR